MAGFAEKNSLYVSQAPGEHQGPLLTLGANHRKRPSTFQGHRPAGSAGTPAGRLDRGGAVLERERELYLQRLSTAATSGKERSTPKREFFALFRPEGITTRPQEVTAWGKPTDHIYYSGPLC